MDVIGGKLFSNHPKNMNHVHKYTDYLFSVLIYLGKNISGGETVFYDRLKSSDLGNRAYVLKHLHGRIIFGPFEKFFRDGIIWRGHIAVVSFIITKEILVHFYRHGDWFYSQYINKTI